MRLSDRVIFQASSAAAVSRRASESLYRRLTLRASAKGGGNAEAPAGGTLTEPLPSRIFRCAPGIWWGLNRRPNQPHQDRKSVVKGKRVSVRVDPRGRRYLQKKTMKEIDKQHTLQ